MAWTGAFKTGLAGLCVTAVMAGAGDVLVAGAQAAVIEKKTTLESVKSGLEDGLGLTPEQRERIRAIREDFRARQAAIKNALNAKYEALRQELDGDSPARAKANPIVAEIKALQGQLTDNRVDVVFKLREIYTARQIRKIKQRSQEQGKAMAVKKKGKKGKKTLLKKK